MLANGASMHPSALALHTSKEGSDKAGTGVIVDDWGLHVHARQARNLKDQLDKIQMQMNMMQQAASQRPSGTHQGMPLLRGSPNLQGDGRLVRT